MINSKLRFHGKVKWKMNKNNIGSSYHPVLVIQKKSYSLPCIILDFYGNLAEVDQICLFDEPPYKKATHIATHVDNLKELCSRHPWQSPIQLGITECTWVEQTNSWHQMNNYEQTITGTIQNIKYHKRSGETGYMVFRHDWRQTVFIKSTEYKFAIFGTHEYKSAIENNNKTMKRFETENQTLKSQLEKEELKRTQLDEAVRKLDMTIEKLRNQIAQQKKIIGSLNTDKNHLTSRVTLKCKELKDSQNECHKAITRKEDSERKFKTIMKNYDNLKQETRHLKKQEKEHQQLVNKLRDQIAKQKNAIGSLKLENDHLSSRITKSNKETQLFKQQYNELKQKYNQQITYSDYLTWDHQNIADWIVSINNKKYSKYYEKLRNCLKQECIDGSLLEDLDKNDLHRFGITIFIDKKDIYNAIQDIIKKTKRIKEIENKKIWMNKSIIKWTTDDVLKWLTNLNLPNEVYYKIAFEIAENSECNGEDIISLQSIEDVSNAFYIKNNKKLCGQIFAEIKKIQEQNEFDTEQKYDNKLITEIIDNTFRINIFSQGKYMVLNEKVTKNITIQSIQNMYKQQSGVEASINDIHLYSKSKLLPPNNTLEDVNIIDDNNLITIKFGVDGAEAT